MLRFSGCCSVQCSGPRVFQDARAKGANCGGERRAFFILSPLIGLVRSYGASASLSPSVLVVASMERMVDKGAVVTVASELRETWVVQEGEWGW